MKPISLVSLLGCMLISSTVSASVSPYLNCSYPISDEDKAQCERIKQSDNLEDLNRKLEDNNSKLDNIKSKLEDIESKLDDIQSSINNK